MGLVIVVLSGGTLISGKTLIERYEGTVRQADLLGGAGNPSRRQSKLTGPLNVLLVGLDYRESAKRTDKLARADSIIVMHVPQSMDRAYLFSIPRDAIVEVPEFPAVKFPGTKQERINAAFAIGAGTNGDRTRGAQLLAQTVKLLTGLPGFDAAAVIDFDGFKRVVDALGGVQMCVDVDTKSIHRTGVVYRKGCQRMNGKAALDYVRQRKTIAGGDYARQRHQQQFTKAIAKEATSRGVLTSPAKLDKVLRSAGRSATVSTGDLSLSEWIFGLRGVTAESITLIKTPGQGAYDAQNNYRGERLNPVAKDTFRALRENQIEAFLTEHPELVNRDA